jgi:hypothetical protein
MLGTFKTRKWGRGGGERRALRATHSSLKLRNRRPAPRLRNTSMCGVGLITPSCRRNGIMTIMMGWSMIERTLVTLGNLRHLLVYVLSHHTIRVLRATNRLRDALPVADFRYCGDTFEDTTAATATS